MSTSSPYFSIRSCCNSRAPSSLIETGFGKFPAKKYVEPGEKHIFEFRLFYFEITIKFFDYNKSLVTITESLQSGMSLAWIGCA